MPYTVRVLIALVGGILAACGTITALAVLWDVHSDDPRWVRSQAAAGVGVGLVAASQVRRDPPA